MLESGNKIIHKSMQIRNKSIPFIMSISTPTTTATGMSTPVESPSRVAVAAALPSLFGILLFVLLVLSIILPRAQRHLSDEEIKKKKKDRFVVLNKTARPLSYEKWCKKMKLEHPENVGFEEPVWYVLTFPSNSTPNVVLTYSSVICLEVIDKKALVRGLQCYHVFHQSCLDGWFGRLHDYCPLCHRLIVSREGGPHNENEAENGSIHDEDFLLPPTQYPAPTDPAPTDPVVELVPSRT